MWVRLVKICKSSKTQYENGGGEKRWSRGEFGGRERESSS